MKKHREIVELCMFNLNKVYRNKIIFQKIISLNFYTKDVYKVVNTFIQLKYGDVEKTDIVTLDYVQSLCITI